MGSWFWFPEIRKKNRNVEIPHVSFNASVLMCEVRVPMKGMMLPGKLVSRFLKLRTNELPGTFWMIPEEKGSGCFPLPRQPLLV